MSAIFEMQMTPIGICDRFNQMFNVCTVSGLVNSQISHPYRSLLSFSIFFFFFFPLGVVLFGFLQTQQIRRESVKDILLIFRSQRNADRPWYSKLVLTEKSKRNQ